MKRPPLEMEMMAEDVTKEAHLPKSAYLARTVFALADPVRLRMLNLMLSGAVSSRHVAQVLKINLPMIRRHIIYLREGGLVSVSGGGKYRGRYYTLGKHRDGIEFKLLEIMLSFLADEPELQADIMLLNKIRTETSKTKAQEPAAGSEISQSSLSPSFGKLSLDDDFESKSNEHLNQTVQTQSYTFDFFLASSTNSTNSQYKLPESIYCLPMLSISRCKAN